MRTLNRKLAKAMALGMSVSIGALAPVQGPVAAVSGTTDITINVPDIIILHYYSALTLDFDDLNQALDEGTPTLGPVALAANVTFAGGLAATLDSTYETLPGGVMTVTIEDAWAVRALTSLGNVTVSTSLDVADATNTAASTVTLGSLQVDSPNDTDSGTFGTTSEFSAPGMAKPTAEVGDVRFTLDISGATLPGAHTGARYTLTATAT